MAPPDLFSKLYRSHFSFVWKLVLRLGVHESDVEDVIQDVFRTAYRRFDDYDRGRPFRRWVYGIAFHTVGDYRRKRSREVSRAARAGDTPLPTTSAFEQIAARRSIMQALDTMDFDQRTVFVLKELEEWSAPEISEELQVPLNTVYSRLRLARAKFKAAVQQQRAERVPCPGEDVV